MSINRVYQNKPTYPPSDLKDERRVSQTEIDLAITAAELNKKAEAGGIEERISQAQFNSAVQGIESFSELAKSGRYRVISYDSWDHDVLVRGDFDSEEKAKVYAYWSTYRDRDYHGYSKKFGKTLHEMMEKLESEGKDPLEVVKSEFYKKGFSDYEELPIGAPSWFSQSLEKEIRKIRSSEPLTSSILYIFDPEGNFIDEIKV